MTENNIKLVNEDGKIVGKNPETSETVPIELGDTLTESLSTEDLNSRVWITPNDNPNDIIDEYGDNTIYLFESGEWNTEDTEQIRFGDGENIALIGQKNSTIIKDQGGHPGGVIRIGDTDGIFIDGITIEATNPSENNSRGILAESSDHITVENCTVIGTGRHAINIGGNPDGEAIDITIRNNYIENIREEKGINPYGPYSSGGDIHASRIVGNTVIDTGQEGIHPSTDSYYNIVFGNHIEDADSAGIDSHSSHHNTIAMNVVRNCDSGIDDAGNATGQVRCFGNYIEGHETFGIHYVTDGHLIFGNTIHNPNGATADIQLDGSNSVVTLNQVENSIAGNVAANLVHSNRDSTGNEPTHQAFEPKQHGDVYYARNFSGSDADERLDNALDEVPRGAVLQLEDATYSRDREITERVVLQGTATGQVDGTMIDDGSQWKITNDRLTVRQIRLGRDNSKPALILDDRRIACYEMIMRGAGSYWQINGNECTVVGVNGGGGGEIEFTEDSSDCVAVGITPQNIEIADNGTNNQFSATPN